MKLKTKNKKNKSAFSLIEIIVTLSLIGFMTVVFVRNFSPSSTKNISYLEESVNIMLADIRNVQQRALAGALYPDSTGTPVARCGYGIHYVDSTTYALYVGPKPSAANNYCANLNRNYTVSADVNIGDTIIETKKVFHPTLSTVFFSDIFFEPPGPKIYTNNVSSPYAYPAHIIITSVPGQPCLVAGQCQSICVYSSGSIITQNTGGSGSACQPQIQNFEF